jgi:hypothetical protein
MFTGHTPSKDKAPGRKSVVSNKIMQNGRLDWAFANEYEDALIAQIDRREREIDKLELHMQHLSGGVREKPCDEHRARRATTRQKVQGQEKGSQVRAA